MLYEHAPTYDSIDNTRVPPYRGVGHIQGILPHFRYDTIDDSTVHGIDGHTPFHTGSKGRHLPVFPCRVWLLPYRIQRIPTLYHR